MKRAYSSLGMMIAGRPFGLTPWRIERTQSTGLYAAVTPPGPAVRLGARISMLSPSSTTTPPLPSMPWQSPQPRERNR